MVRRLTRRWIAPSGAEVREEVTSGPPALPGRESARGPQHGGESAERREDAEGVAVQGPCDMAKARLLESYVSSGANVHTPRYGVWNRGHRHRMIPTFVISTLPAGGRRATSLFKGTDGTHTSRSIRLAQGEFGMAYGARALWSRSVRSSRCAVKRTGVSPAQRAETRGDVSGSDG